MTPFIYALLYLFPIVEEISSYSSEIYAYNLLEMNRDISNSTIIYLLEILLFLQENLIKG